MQQPYAEATCVLKVQPNCQACKMKTMEVLGSVCGVYNIDMNAEEGLAKVQAVVEPNLFLKALAGTGPHAEPKWVKIQHPKMHQSFYHNYETNPYGNGYSHGSIGYDPYSHNGYSGGALGYSPYNHGHSNGYSYGAMADPYQYPMMESHYPYHGSNPYYHGSSHPPTSCYGSRRRGPFQY